MGVYIKGMEMPTRCTGCPFVRDVGDYTFVGCKLNVGLAVNRAFPYRHGDCPLVPVPPHGDLIDKDETMNAILEERGEDTACWFAGIVNDMPAIIPSDKAEAGE